MLTALLWRIFYHEEDNVIEFDVQVTCFNLRNGLRRIVKKDRSKVQKYYAPRLVHGSEINCV